MIERYELRASADSPHKFPPITIDADTTDATFVFTIGEKKLPPLSMMETVGFYYAIEALKKEPPNASANDAGTEGPRPAEPGQGVPNEPVRYLSGSEPHGPVDGGP